MKKKKHTSFAWKIFHEVLHRQHGTFWNFRAVVDNETCPVASHHQHYSAAVETVYGLFKNAR